MTHPDLRQLQAYAAVVPTASPSDPGPPQEVARHLEARCPVCVALVLSYRAARSRRTAQEEAFESLEGAGEERWPPPSAGAADETAAGDAYDEVFDRVFETVRRLELDLGRERARAAVQVEKLLGQPRQRQLLMVRNAERCRTAGVCELLMERARELRFDSPRGSLAAAEVAVAVAERLSSETYGFSFLSDLQAQAWCWVGNGRRLTGDLEGAEMAFEEAEDRLSRGAGIALDRLRYLRLRSILVRDRGRPDEAEELQDEALALCARDGLTHEAALQLLNRANLQAERHDFEGEIALIGRALDLLDSEREPRMTVVAIHNLTSSLHETGRHGEALALLVRWRPLYLEHGDRGFLLRLHWLEGSIARELGRLDQAQGAFQEARRGFVELEMPYDAALVSLELALVHLRRGESRRVRSLAAEMLPFFQSREIHREASAALLLFCKAAEQERASSSMVRRVLEYLQAARHDPSLTFEGGEDGAPETPNSPATMSTKPTP